MVSLPQPQRASDGYLSLADLAVAARTCLASRDELVARTQSTVRRFVIATVGAQHADDVVQDTYLRALASLRRYDPERDLTAWLITIARRTAIDSLRREHRRGNLAAALESQRTEPLASLTDRSVNDLVRRLEPQRRIAFVLTQVLGYNYNEAAAIARCPVGTIRSRVHRARLELLAALDAADHA